MERLRPRPGGVYVDATLGLGGHAEALLEATGGRARLVGLEWDDQAADRAAERLKRFGDAVTVVRENYARLPAVLDKLNIAAVDGLLLDLGVSSLQLDDPSRGFGFSREGPLDMRMSSQVGRTAAELLRGLGERDLEEILRRYGEEPRARSVARALWRARGNVSRGDVFGSTRALAGFVAGVLGGRRGRTHPATRVFQALRIAVNGELDNLQKLLDSADTLLAAPGGRIVVISFHSLEDRIVKVHVRSKEREGAWKRVDKKAVRPSRTEELENPRSRSAKLRAAEKL